MHAREEFFYLPALKIEDWERVFLFFEAGRTNNHPSSNKTPYLRITFHLRSDLRTDLRDRRSKIDSSSFFGIDGRTLNIEDRGEWGSLFSVAEDRRCVPSSEVMTENGGFFEGGVLHFYGSEEQEPAHLHFSDRRLGRKSPSALWTLSIVICSCCCFHVNNNR